MDVVYVVPSDFPEMTPTPGQFLAAELDRIGMKRSKLADLLDVNWPTVDRWTKDNGFGEKNQERAALAMGFQPDHFKRPDFTVLHQERCRDALAEFLGSPLAPSDVSDEERASLMSQQVPLSKRPTPKFYAGLLFLLRGHLDASEFEAELAENEALARNVAAKLDKIAKSPEGVAVASKRPGKKKASKKDARRRA